jgi:16S rRNA A1518/A1519 N6-dimethyltransferase RsmA/KsgA/DIM1 with predicted DNA glycosylase/AP lyase activity
MTGIINWNEMWKALHHNGFHHHGEDPGARWDQRAKEFNQRVMRHKEKAQSQVASLGLSPEETVLDVGAGTGRLSIPMAKIAKSVTALDQSGGMLACLKENMDAEGIANINIIQKAGRMSALMRYLSTMLCCHPTPWGFTIWRRPYPR